MKRKINQVGSGTLTVSLPNKWVKNHGLFKGDELEVIEKPNALIIKSESIPIPTEATVKVAKPPELIRRYIGNLYRKGVDIIKIEFDDPKDVQIVQSYTQLFLGLEMTEQGKNYCVIRDVANVKEDEFDHMLNRMFLLTLNMSEDLLKGISEQNWDILENIILLEKTNNKLFNFCLRVINKPNFSKNLSLNTMIVLRLEDSADRPREIVEYMLERKYISVSKEIIKLIEEICAYIRTIYEIFLKFDTKKANLIHNKYKELSMKALLIMEKGPHMDIIIVHLLVNLIEDIYECSSPIFGLNL
jgi:phosphate uptake regulator